MNWTISFEPFMPVAGLIFFGLLAIALAALTLLARQRGGFLRTAALAALFAALLNPNINQEIRTEVRIFLFPKKPKARFQGFGRNKKRHHP